MSVAEAMSEPAPAIRSLSTAFVVSQTLLVAILSTAYIVSHTRLAASQYCACPTPCLCRLAAHFISATVPDIDAMHQLSTEHDGITRRDTTLAQYRASSSHGVGNHRATLH
eukprot:3940791-Rhodomonas_salina.5